ncbi:MAG: response regulator [Pirellulales bacterium]
MNKKLLITDDALIIRTIIKDVTTEAGWSVVGEAGNGAEAVELYKKLQPDAVTLDLVMPVSDGLHAIEGIIEHDPEAKILVVSALEQTDILRQALQLGASDFIIKPFHKDSVVSALEKMVGQTAEVG